MEETKKLAIPDGYEFDRVENGEVILKKKEIVLPRTLGECTKGIPLTYFPARDWWQVPGGNESSIRALCKLLICRNAWWKLLKWKPDWESESDKCCIHNNGGDIGIFILNYSNRVLAFPDLETANQFLETFRDLIEEAKELL